MDLPRVKVIRGKLGGFEASNFYKGGHVRAFEYVGDIYTLISLWCCLVCNRR